jgi:uncharacterized protein (DUF608 family)
MDGRKQERIYIRPGGQDATAFAGRKLHANAAPPNSENLMTTSRREFLSTAAAALATAHATSSAQTPHSGKAATPTPAASQHPAQQHYRLFPSGVNTVIPSTMPMGSGAPLGGLGTGFIELRADGCFHEWQIFNSGPWAQNARSTTAPPGTGPQYLRFLLRTHSKPDTVPQIRRLYLRSDEGDNYTLPYVQDIESIDYQASFPVTHLQYNDATIPVRVSVLAFSPFIPGNERDSATPGFHLTFTIENTSHTEVDVSLSAFLNNPLASAMPKRRLTNTISQDNGVTALFLSTAAESDFPSGIGDMCLSVTSGHHSYVSGTFQDYALPGVCHWGTPRSRSMLLDILDEIVRSVTLPNSTATTDPGLRLPTEADIDGMSPDQVQNKIRELSADPLLDRVFSDARKADPVSFQSIGKNLLKEVRTNLLGRGTTPRLIWGTGALASAITLAPGAKTDIRFTLSWFFPHHLTSRGGREMGHMYANWFASARDVNRFLCANYAKHRDATESFAHTLADTSLGEAMAFAWSSQLSTAVFNTWWTKENEYAMWEGLGCCGLSTTDVDYQGSFPIVALFPALKLRQMKHIIGYQNALGQVPHNYRGDIDAVDNGFARVDVNSQFVMMVCRDFLWTGDREYLTFMWPYIVKAMAFTESLDTNNDGLPDRDTGLQTYDQWRMQGAPSYIASLWIGSLRAAIRLAADTEHPEEHKQWSELLVKASTNFDELLFNGDYYSLWVDGAQRDELCMTDQISGEWFSHLIGLPTSISGENLAKSIDSIFKNNFNPEFGVHNATAPLGGLGLLKITNLQAGGVWSGIEFAFASFLMDHGRYADGVKIVEAVHQRYMRSGQPWNHVECGGHYSRAMSSWATLLAATGFKPDTPKKTLGIIPTIPGDFRAPWVTADGFGSIARTGRLLSISCVYGSLSFQTLRVDLPSRSARIGAHHLSSNSTTEGGASTLRFATPVALTSNQTLTLE